MEFVMEEGKLEETLKILDAEMLNYIAKRKYISEYIINYRKKFLEEYRDDDDKVVDYFDHESYVKEEAFRTIDKRLKEFTILKESPYFGKITFNEEEDGVEDLYVGRFGLTPEKTYEPIVVDWRAPVAAMFYKGRLGETSYNSPDGKINANLVGRRQLIVKKGELKGLFDSAIDVKDEILQSVLTSNAGKSLQDIVMTIQQEQDEIIRAPKDKVVVVNGVAGSGKTTIALHRVSYLLYNYRKEFGDKVLILGPNDIFMDYISQVLPTLGEGGIKQMTFQSFALEQIGLKEPIKNFSEYIEEAMRGDIEALADYKYKSSRDFGEFLENTIYEMEKEYFKVEEVNFFGKVIVDKDEISELFTKYYGYMPLFRRAEKIKRVLISKIKDKRDEYVRILNEELKSKVESLSKDDFEIERVNLEYKRRIRIREIIREVMNSREALDKWINHEDTLSLYKRVSKTEELGYKDLEGILYLMIKLEGKRSENQIKHIVIDEGQDYTITQFKVIKELTGCKSYTIVGDSNQRLIEVDEEPALLNLKEVFKGNDDIVEFKLNKSYRSTQQIMEYASKFLDENSIIPLVRTGEAVIEEETTSNEDTIATIISIIEDFQEEGLESIAVIVSNKESLGGISKLLKEKIKILTIDKEDIIYSGGTVLLSAYYAKGLEFDGVILLEGYNEISNLVKYIMCTRALHRLAIIKQVLK
jgi:DNA helicase-2/ATP-dependent DNA helicase PcrA